MATQKKTADLTIELPRRLVAGARSSVRPTDSSDKGDRITQNALFALMNTAASSYRRVNSITQLMRHLARAEGPFSTAIFNMVEVASTPFRVSAYDAATHTFNAEATQLAYTILTSWDTPMDYDGFSQKKSLASTINMMFREEILTGALCAELVLNKERLPERLQIVGAETLTWLSDGKKGSIPAQEDPDKNDPVPLDIPTFFVEHLHADPDMVVPRSMMESALKMLVYFEEFMDDVRRAVRQSGHNRLKIVLNAEKLKASAADPVRRDPKKLRAYMEDVQTAVQTQINAMTPEEALILFDTADADVMNSGMGSKMDYTPLLNVVVGQYATGMKTPPSILGLRLESGSQALGNIETLMFLKTAKALHTPAETVLNRALTLACRLYGADVYVEGKFDPIDLRPELELQAFRAVQRSNIKDDLSDGFISDDEAANLLGCFPRPAGAPKLSGTMYRNKGSASTDSDPADMTNPGDTAAGRTLQPPKNVPRKGGGRSQ